MVSKYYAVVNGRIPGIYHSWKLTEAMIKDYPGAIFKSFYNQSEAENYLYPKNKNTYCTAYLYLQGNEKLALLINQYQVSSKIPNLNSNLYALYVLFSLVDCNLQIYHNLDFGDFINFDDNLLAEVNEKLAGRKITFMDKSIDSDKLEQLKKLLTEETSEELKISTIK